MPDPAQVRSMFARIAGRYDFLNRLLSLGTDRRWRALVVESSGPLEGRLVVDACCGTGELALDYARAGARVVGVDFTLPMLRRAQAKLARGPRGPREPSRRARFVAGDAQRLPIESRCADLASVAFGIRNLADPAAGLAEMARVLKPGGRVLVLEFAPPPSGLFGALYGLYFRRVLPRIGRWVSGDADAYSYLPRTVLAWPEPAEFQRSLEAAGLVDCGWRALSRGIACLHWGRVPAEGARP